MSRLRDNVERWLVHEGYEFQQVKTEDASFKILIKNSDGLGNDTEVLDRKSTRLNSSHSQQSRMPSSA